MEFESKNFIFFNIFSFMDKEVMKFEVSLNHDFLSCSPGSLSQQHTCSAAQRQQWILEPPAPQKFCLSQIFIRPHTCSALYEATVFLIIQPISFWSTLSPNSYIITSVTSFQCKVHIVKTHIEPMTNHKMNTSHKPRRWWTSKQLLFLKNMKTVRSHGI